MSYMGQRKSKRQGRVSRQKGISEMKSLLSGGIFGGVIAVVGVGVISVIAPPPPGNEAPGEPMVDIAEVATEQDQSETAIELGASSDTTAELEAPEGVATDQEIDPPVADTTPLVQPDANSETVEVESPEPESDTVVVATGEDQVLPSPQSLAPQAPSTENTFDIAATETEPLPVIEEAPESNEAIEAFEPEVVSEETLADPEQEVEIAPVEAPLVEPVEEEPVEVIAPDENADDTPIVVAIIDDDERTLPGANSGVKVNRIAGPEPEDQQQSEQEVTLDASAPAIERYAAQFETTNGKPAMSVILLHNDGNANGPAMVASLQFPVTVVIDSESANASGVLAAYRDVGAEVAFSTSFPRRASPSDVEVVMAAAVRALPETVALVDIGDGGLQSDRSITRQAVAALAADGRGLVTKSQGLNSALREAESEGVPAGVIYRDLDGDGQDARVIRRFLDQAAFRARQNDGVILLARMRQETIDALDAWNEANRAGQVALAPLTTVLLAD